MSWHDGLVAFVCVSNLVLIALIAHSWRRR